MSGPKDQFNENGIIGYTNNGSQTIDNFVSNVIRGHSKYLVGGVNQSVHVDHDFNLTEPPLSYKKLNFNLNNIRSITAGKSWNYFNFDETKANNVSKWGINQYLISGGTDFDNKNRVWQEVNKLIDMQLIKIKSIISHVSMVIPPSQEPDGVNQSTFGFTQLTSSPTDRPKTSFLTQSMIVQAKIEVLQGFFDNFDKLYPELEQTVDEIQKILQNNHRPVASLSLAANGLVAEVFSDPNRVIADRRALSPEARFYMLPGVPLSFADPKVSGWLDNPKNGLFPEHNNIPTVGFRTYTDKSDIKFSETDYPLGTPYDNTSHIPKIMESFLATTPENMILSVDKHQSNIGNYSASIILNYDLGHDGGPFHGYNLSQSCSPEIVMHCKQEDGGIGGTVRVTQKEVEVISNEINILTQEVSDNAEGGFLNINKNMTQLGNLSRDGISGITMEKGNVSIIARSNIRFITENHSDIFRVDERRVSLAESAFSLYFLHLDLKLMLLLKCSVSELII